MGGFDGEMRLPEHLLKCQLLCLTVHKNWSHPPADREEKASRSYFIGDGAAVVLERPRNVPDSHKY